MDTDSRRVNASQAGWLVRKHERLIRARIADGSLAAAKAIDGHTWMIALASLAAVRGWQIDPDRLATLVAESQGVVEDFSTVEELLHRIVALEQQVQSLVRSGSPLRIDPDGAEVAPQPGGISHFLLLGDVGGKRLRDDPDGDPEGHPDGEYVARPPRLTRPLRAVGQRYEDVPDEELLEAVLMDLRGSRFVGSDLYNAHKGWLRFQVWGHLCRMPQKVVESQARQVRDGSLRKGLSDVLTLHKGGGMRAIRYVDATERERWLHHWCEVSRTSGEPAARRIPPKGEADRALATLCLWADEVAPR